MVSEDLNIFSSKRSFLLRKRMMDVSPNHLLLQIESNSFKLSCIRFCKKRIFIITFQILQRNPWKVPNNTNIRTVVSSSCNTWSYSDIATQNMMAVTSSKQWIHFFRSDLWPPTSNSLKKENGIQLDVNYNNITNYANDFKYHIFVIYFLLCITQFVQTFIIFTLESITIFVLM